MTHFLPGLSVRLLPALIVPFMVVPTTVSASHTAEPAAVTVAGDMQSELGCPGDWQPDCASTHLAYDTDDGVWQGVFSVPAGNWEYKAALDDSWNEAYGANAVLNGANIGLAPASPTDVKFYYSHETHWITDNVNAPVAVAVGDFQSELGCPGDWQPDCLRSWLQDPDGDGTFAFRTDRLAAGDYSVKVAMGESWTENYGAGGVQGGPNIPFTVASDCTAMLFSFNGATKILTIGPAPPVQPASVTVAGSLQDELGCPGDWQPDCAVTGLSYDTFDGVWQEAFNVPAGSWEYKAALDDSWSEAYGANGVLNGANIPLNLGAPTDVKFYYSHETHWVADNRGFRIATAAGSFQSELGCPGDWQPDCLRSWLQDPDGDGTFTFAARLPAGSFEVKATLDESWTENYGVGGVAGGANIPFTVPTACTEVFFSYNDGSHRLAVGVGAPPATGEDFGDAPDPTYPTLLASDGARHTLGSGLFLGSGVDGEADGQPTAAAAGDDADGQDDEDGVTFTSAVGPGATAGLDVTVSAPCTLSAWIDYNDDGDWADAGEELFPGGQALTAGVNSLTYSVPAGAAAGTSFARFRCTTDGAVSYAGPASDGEVEDYAVTIGAPGSPEINIRQGGTDIPDGGTHDFGSGAVGTDRDVVFTVQNTGTGPLNIGTPLTVSGPQGGDFSVPVQPAATVAAGDSTTFTLRYSPSQPGARMAAIALVSDDSDENPYDIALTGTGSAAPLRRLTVAAAGSGSGTVTSLPAGIDCGSDCMEDYPDGTVVTLAAVPDGLSVFAGWSGDGDCADGTLVMTADRSCSAAFTLLPAGPVENDWNGDGHADLLWRNGRTGQNFLAYLAGTEPLGTARVPTLRDVRWSLGAVTDVNGDGRPDVIGHHRRSGAVRVWQMDGPELLSTREIGRFSPEWRLSGAADFNGDGSPDLLLRHMSTGANVIVYLKGTVPSDTRAIPRLADLSWMIAGVGDYNGDGRPDIVWRDSVGGRTALWFMNDAVRTGGHLFPSAVDPDLSLEQVSDFNGDGKADMFWRNHRSGANVISFMDGTEPAGTRAVAPLRNPVWGVVD